MITAFIGLDTQKARKALGILVEKAQAKHPDAVTSRFSDLSFDIGLANEALHAENLFGGGSIVIFDGILDHPEGEKFYQTIFKATSAEVFIRETDPKKEIITVFQTIGALEEFPLLKKIEKRENSFAIADAIGARNKKAAWVEFEKARRREASMEEVHGTIFWAIKSMYIAGTLKKEEALRAGMKEFTYRTYNNFAKKFLISELKASLSELKEMYHKGHRGEGDLEVLLEKFLLKL